MKVKTTIAALALLLAGCTGQAPEPVDDEPGPPAVEEPPNVVYLNITRSNAQFMGIDGTLFLTAGPGAATVPEHIYDISPLGELVEGKVVLEWSSTSAPTIQMALVLTEGGEELRRVEGDGTLELELPKELGEAVLKIMPAGSVGAHALVQWDMVLTSQWIET